MRNPYEMRLGSFIGTHFLKLEYEKKAAESGLKGKNGRKTTAESVKLL